MTLEQIRTTEDHVDVLIVGAGPAGLMLSTWLSRCGIRTRIVDKRGTKVRPSLHPLGAGR